MRIRTCSSRNVFEHRSLLQTNFALERISAISPFALATAPLVVSLLGRSVGLAPFPESFTSGLSAVRVAPVGCRI